MARTKIGHVVVGARSEWLAENERVQRLIRDQSTLAGVFAGLARALSAAGHDARDYQHRPRTRTRAEAESSAVPV